MRTERCAGCGRTRIVTRLDAMIDAAVKTENLKHKGRIFNHITGGREVFHVLPRFSEGE